MSRKTTLITSLQQRSNTIFPNLPWFISISTQMTIIYQAAVNQSKFLLQDLITFSENLQFLLLRLSLINKRVLLCQIKQTQIKNKGQINSQVLQIKRILRPIYSHPPLRKSSIKFIKRHKTLIKWRKTTLWFVIKVKLRNQSKRNQ